MTIRYNKMCTDAKEIPPLQRGEGRDTEKEIPPLQRGESRDTGLELSIACPDVMFASQRRHPILEQLLPFVAQGKLFQ